MAPSLNLPPYHRQARGWNIVIPMEVKKKLSSQRNKFVAFIEFFPECYYIICDV
jgi:hypothetical protein